MKILIETVLHTEQRYPTVGDWQWTKASVYPQWAQQNLGLHLGSPHEPVLTIRTSKFSDWRYEALIAVHELVEALLCKHAGISEAQIDEFDLSFEKTRSEFSGEPGDHPDSPYFRQHQLATLLEKYLARCMGVNWLSYESEVDSL